MGWLQQPPGAWAVIVTDEAAQKHEKWLVEDMIPTATTLVVAQKGAGKTTFVRHLVKALLDPSAAGRQFCGRTIQSDPLSQVAWIETDAGDANEIRNHFQNDPRIEVIEWRRRDQIQLKGSEWAKWAPELQAADLIVWDHTGGFIDGNMNEDSTAVEAMTRLKELGKPAIALHHSSSKGSSSRPRPLGHTQWEANARSIVTLGHKGEARGLANQLQVRPNYAAPWGCRLVLSSDAVDISSEPPSAEDGQASGSKRRRSRTRLDSAEKARRLGSFVQCESIPTPLKESAGSWATAIVGPEGCEAPIRKQRLGELGLTAVSNKSIAQLIRDEPDAFAEGLRDARSPAARK